MKLSILILSFLAISLNMRSIFCQSVNSNNLIISDIQRLLIQTKQSVRAYLSTILVDAIVANVDAIFASASLNITSVVNNRYICARISSTTRKSNCLLNLVSFKIKSIFSNNFNDQYDCDNFHYNYNQNK